MMSDARSAVRFVAVSTPLAVTPELREFICSHPREYGAGAGVQEYLAADFAWEIRGAADVVMGYVWVTRMTGTGMPHGLYLDMAIYNRFQSSGVGSIALAFVENELRGLGVDELFMQVNNTSQETGLRVRRWLLRRGYLLAMRDEHFGGRLSHCSDEEYVLKHPLPVHLYKSLLA